LGGSARYCREAMLYEPTVGRDPGARIQRPTLRLWVYGSARRSDKATDAGVQEIVA